jgi:enoyl-CoA hydratase/carnithine racemase
VSGVHEDDELLPEAMDLADQMAGRPAEALFETKRLLREVLELDTDAAFRRMFETISERLRSREHQEALSDYMGRLKARAASSERS